MIRDILYTISALLLFVFLNGCSDRDGSFDNKLFNTSAKTETVLMKLGVNEMEQVIKVAMAQRVGYDVNITYRVDPSLASTYNEAYYDNATVLPEGHYEIPQPTVTIPAGGLSASDVIVRITNLDKLDRETLYVLPVTIDNANLDILNSARTTYYVIKAGALINTVADIEKNYIEMKAWKTPTAVNSLPKMTMEALVRGRDLERGISSIMGIEGYFLIRLGDSSPGNQIQIATPNENFPAANAIAGLPTNKWVHIALTYDSADGKMTLYVDGRYQAHKNISMGNLDFAKIGDRGFYIGYSYNDERYLVGDIAECRIWNVIRTQEEIAENPYYVDPQSPGLAAYWKFDEGSGKIIHDSTDNENHMESKNVLKWTEVALPEAKK